MPVTIPTTQERTEKNIANLESKLNQDSPLADVAFLRVLGALMGMNDTGLNRYALERSKQNLVLTANLDQLKTVLGPEYGVEYRAAEPAELEIELPATTGTLIPSSLDHIGDPNNERYRQKESVTASAGVAVIDVVARNAGVSGNLNIDDTMTTSFQVPGAETVSTITAVLNVGAEAESLESYRRRILNEIRTVGGGGNAADYRTWAELVAGVFRAFPYAGAPVFNLPGWKDGDMEESGVADWTSGNSAVLTKETSSPHSGLQNLRVTYNAVNNPFASQAPLRLGRTYRIKGWARGDGTCKPSLRTTSSLDFWTGTSAVSWQKFDLDFLASGVDLLLFSDCTGAGFVEFDDITIIQKSLSGDRSVFVEADTDIDPDGIAPQSLLDEVRANINFNQTTGEGRPPLGEIEDTLYVESIYRTTMHVEIRGLEVPADKLAEVKEKIQSESNKYFRSIAPFIEGIDFEADRNDLITDLTLSRIIQDILDPVGGSASGIGFGTVIGLFVSSYLLTQGELSKLGTITYV